MSAETQATPRPWWVATREYEEYGAFYITAASTTKIAKLDTRSSVMDEHNAELIVNAVNAHDALVAALEEALSLLTHGADNLEQGKWDACVASLTRQAEAALKLAKG